MAPINLKVGLTQLGRISRSSWTTICTFGPVKVASLDRTSGFGDITARLKINFWGNEGLLELGNSGPTAFQTAFGIIPFVKPLPDASLCAMAKRKAGINFCRWRFPAGGGNGVGSMTEDRFCPATTKGRLRHWNG